MVGFQKPEDFPGWGGWGGSGADGQADALKATRCQRPGRALNPSCVRPRASPPLCMWVLGTRCTAGVCAGHQLLAASALVFCKKVAPGADPGDIQGRTAPSSPAPPSLLGNALSPSPQESGAP